MNILGLIPARGGSQGIPRKNVALVGGRPLLAYTCEAARRSRRLSRIVLSTDDDEIAAVGRACQVEVPFRRPPDLAQGDTPTLPVALHAVQWLQEQEGWATDIVVVLQPTSPLRLARHIDEALDRMEAASADTVVSVVPVPHRYSPYSIGRIDDGWLRDFWEQPVPFDRYRRQAGPVFYARNGPAVLATRTRVLLESHSFFGKRVLPYVMPEEDSLDVDTEPDLRMAEWLLARRAAAEPQPAVGVRG
jgi:CMP-N-acetylneuraminic acid synthetase